MKNRLTKWRKVGFSFKLEWLLRCVNVILTGEALFSALKDVDTATFQKGLQQSEKSIDYFLNLISARLGLDHDQVLGSRYAFPVLTRYLIQRGGQLADYKEQDKLLYWYVNTLLWGRYAGSTESVLNQDLGLIEDTEGALDRLINQLRQNRGDLRLNADDFKGWSRGARFYPLLYMLTRVCQAKDWATGIELSKHLLGNLSSLQVHHIFPKSLLYQNGYSQADVNAIANFTFLTQDTNLLVSDRSPDEYLEKFIAKQPGTVESHWIPMDRELWEVENYLNFLAARRVLLAKAANDFLDGLVSGMALEVKSMEPILGREIALIPGGILSEEEDRAVRECNEWVMQQGLPEGEYMYELADDITGEPLAILDLAWPNGLQQGYSQPVALLIDEGQETEEAVNKAGYRYFTDLGTFRVYVEHEILAVETR